MNLANSGTWWSFYVGTPSAVLVTGFSSSLAQPRGIRLKWETVTETDLVGFDIYRAELTGGNYIKINSTLIPAQTPGQMLGNAYTFVDTNAQPGVRYTYKLSQVGTSFSEGDYSIIQGGYYLVRLPFITQ
jgi:hypothetical protein